MKKLWITLTLSAFLIFGTWWGWQILTHDINSYEDKYTSCMEVKKSWLPTIYQLDFQSLQYQQMMKDCEKEANG